MGVLVALIALHPPKLLGIFGQIGVYGIIAASAVPLLVGIFVPSASKRTAWLAALAGLGTHCALYASAYFGLSRYGSLNPAVTATIGILVSAVLALPDLLPKRAPVEAAVLDR